ncbi:hypothetical protein HG530_001003 [Fusarium avenaceum]|nr:hypothetical protein HG530_001003 [Fusarium avenaceum]
MASCDSKCILNQGLLKLGSLTKEIVPAPTGSGGSACKIEDAKLRADVNVRAPDRILRGFCESGWIVDIAHDLKLTSLGGIWMSEIRQFQSKLLHLSNRLRFSLFNSGKVLLELSSLILDLFTGQLAHFFEILIAAASRRVRKLTPQKIRSLTQSPALSLEILPSGVQF